MNEELQALLNQGSDLDKDMRNLVGKKLLEDAQARSDAGTPMWANAALGFPGHLAQEMASMFGTSVVSALSNVANPEREASTGDYVEAGLTVLPQVKGFKQPIKTGVNTVMSKLGIFMDALKGGAKTGDDVVNLTKRTSVEDAAKARQAVSEAGGGTGRPIPQTADVGLLGNIPKEQARKRLINSGLQPSEADSFLDFVPAVDGKVPQDLINNFTSNIPNMTAADRAAFRQGSVSNDLFERVTKNAGAKQADEVAGMADEVGTASKSTKAVDDLVGAADEAPVVETNPWKEITPAALGALGTGSAIGLNMGMIDQLMDNKDPNAADEIVEVLGSEKPERTQQARIMQELGIAQNTDSMPASFDIAGYGNILTDPTPTVTPGNSGASAPAPQTNPIYEIIQQAIQAQQAEQAGRRDTAQQWLDKYMGRGQDNILPGERGGIPTEQGNDLNFFQNLFGGDIEAALGNIGNVLERWSDTAQGIDPARRGLENELLQSQIANVQNQPDPMEAAMLPVMIEQAFASPDINPMELANLLQSYEMQQAQLQDMQTRTALRERELEHNLNTVDPMNLIMMETLKRLNQ